MFSGVMALCSFKFINLCSVYKSSKVDHNFMKLCHNVRYQNVFLKFENGIFALMSYCPLLMKNANFYDV